MSITKILYLAKIIDVLLNLYSILISTLIVMYGVSFFMFFLTSCGDDVEIIKTPEEIIQENVEYCKSVCKLQDSKCNLNNVCNKNCDKLGVRLTELYQEKNISYNII